MNRISRRNVIWIVSGVIALVILALLAVWLLPRLRPPEVASVFAPASFPTQNWQTSTPEEQGFDSLKLAEGLRAIRESGIPIHSLMLIRNGAVFLDAYFYPYDGSTYHDLASVTKSVMTTLIGIAADQGSIDLDKPIVSYFPERTIANRDPNKDGITVRDLVSLSSGLSCDPMDDSPNVAQMQASPDWVQYALDRPAVRKPGQQFAYCSPDMHLLSAILQEATGMTALEFARKNLFEPLGITEVYWAPDLQGYTRGWGDLALRPSDAAKIGLLFMTQGQWDGKQLVSPKWVKEATTAHHSGTGRDEDYGYGWWVASPSEEIKFFLAAGNEGQRLQIIPALNAIVVTTGGGFEYDQIGSYIAAALRDPSKPLPANPAGVEQLAKALTEVKQSPAAQPVPPLSQTAREISGKRYLLAANPATALKSVQLDFDESAEALLTMEYMDESEKRVDRVGLDGLYRPSRVGRPVLAGGRWEDDHTFVIDYNEGPGINLFTLRIYFADGRMQFELPGGRIIEGTLAQD